MRTPGNFLLFVLSFLCLGASHECDDTFTLEVKLPALEEAQQQLREMEAATAVAEQNVMGVGPGEEQQTDPRLKAWLAEQQRIHQVTPPPLGSSPHNPVKITPQKLEDEYAANKVRFKRDYANRWYQITGTVESITDDEIYLEVGWIYPISGALRPLTPESAQNDILTATVGEEFTTTCLLQPSTFQADFYLLVDCATGWNP